MTDVTNSTLESETDYDYAYSYTYDYGLLDSTLQAIALAVSTTSANSLAVGEAAATSTASATTTATTAATVVGATTATADAQTTASSTATSATVATTTASAQTTATTVATDATFTNQRVEWRVTRDGTTVEDSVFDVDPVVDTANPFGDYCVFKIDDSGGAKFDDYERGTRIDAAVSTNAGITFSNRFTGYVVERRENEQAGADVLEVEAYSFDQFLRRNTVTNDQRGNTITQALADIIQTDTPVTYNAANVDVGDDQELTRSYQGETVESTLRDLAFKSNNEDFGVNDDLEFFFRERETVHIDRGIDNTQWFNYDIPELGKETINEVEVWFDDGEESVVVDDGTDKLDLQDNLGLPSPGTQRAELNRPLLTDISDAEDVGRKYLAFRNATLSGTVTTFGLYDAEPGDTIDIEIAPRGIDEEFVIAATEYRWGRDETILTIVERRGDVDDILTELNDSVQRQEMETANRDAPQNRITTTNAAAELQLAFGFDLPDPDDARIVNDGRRLIRDAWTGETVDAIDAIVFGDDNTGLSRSNTDLGNQIRSVATTPTLPDSNSVRYSEEVLDITFSEIGLKAGGTLVFRGVFNDPVSFGAFGTGQDTVKITLTAVNDTSVSRGVLTNDGQTAVRDVLADNNPALPNRYAYGSDGTAVSESDTALGNELVDVSLDEVLIQDADTQSEWESIIPSISADKPFVIDATGPRTAQTCFTTEGENFDRGDTGTINGPPSPSQFSNGNWAALSTSDNFVEYDFTLEHTIPNDNLEVPVRVVTSDTAGGSAATDWRLIGPDDNEIASGTLLNDGIDLTSAFWLSEINNNFITGTFEPGTYTIILDCVTTATALDDQTTFIDVVAPRDIRYPVTLDDTVNGSGYLDGPEKYPSLVEQSLATAGTRRDVTEASFDLTANDVSGSFFVELANDGSTFTRVSNSQTGSVTFASPERDVDARLGLGRYSATTNQTPVNGNDPQQVDTWELSANPDAVVSDNISETLARAVVAPNTLSPGTTIREAGLKSDSVLLTRHEVAEFSLQNDQRLASAETTRFTSDN